jgi:triacylglycerol esterase/lipase EstA (alpha/beta hydrolase family)
MNRSVQLRRSGFCVAFLVSLSCPIAHAEPIQVSPQDHFSRELHVPAPGEDTSFPAAFKTALRAPYKAPPGANDWSCKPSPEHPEPVVLIHGTWANAYNTWAGLAPNLKKHGYCIFAPNFGNNTGIKWMNATADMAESAREIARFVVKVRALTGAARIILIGHSQGGALARYYANLLAPESEVARVVMLAPSNHPTTLSGISTAADKVGVLELGLDMLDAMGQQAAVQQGRPDAGFYRKLNGSGETRPGIAYTVIATRYDQIVTPYTHAYIEASPGATVHNMDIQQVCAEDVSRHGGLLYSRNLYQVVLNELDPAHPRAVECYKEKSTL